MNEMQSYGQRAMGQDAHKLAEVTDKVLFGDIWERRELSKRDRSVITVAALVAMYRLEQLPFHLNLALENGVTKGELIEVITHLAFYSGWPSAASAIKLLSSAAEQD
ncbi:MAG: carboxymuconolactone decarboxylase family protein [Ferrovum sp.]|uniref:carboxymuconolactone decarboxylase family protein n=1 Tax=Ferrovum sp. TaxID=2609467 RepID=UPI0026207FD1|nr:carboxymuconolactone decarboxylase family protein [Ferrovum sp.]MBW8065803.1 carboxymuconolactone decarboxylase family protein [Ferrovum sp.]